MYHRIIKGFQEDQPEFLECEIVNGEVPKWLSGSLLRNGSGKFTIGSDEYQHFFDGLAVIHQYKVDNGKVLYKNKLLESETKDRCLGSQRIIVSEFGTVAYPDPCKSIFTRYFSYFMDGNISDNACVNLLGMGDQLYAMTETPRVKRLKPEDLSTVGEVDTKQIMSLHLNTAHPLQEADGTVYNLGSKFGRHKSSYVVFKVPPPTDGDSDPYNKAEILCKIPAADPLKPSYYHSFAMSENYIVVLAQPLHIKIMSMVWIQLKWSNRGIPDALEWDENGVTTFYLVDKKTGKVLPTTYEAPAMFFFHTINAYEEEGSIVVDVSAFEDASSIQEALYTENIRKGEMGEEGYIPVHPPPITRYTLPLKKHTAEEGEVHVEPITPEVIETTLELPRINDKFTGKKYRYAYGIGGTKRLDDNNLVKVDLETKESLYWTDSRYVGGEPIFVPTPGATEEDDGVLLAPILSLTDEVQSALLILNAKDMTEIAKAEIPANIKVPFSFHGFFSSNY